jgi:hypothetical protein
VYNTLKNKKKELVEMGIYSNAYRGKVYSFRITGIRVFEEEGYSYTKIEMLNLETLRKSNVSLDVVECEDGTAQVGDIIKRQYVRNGVGGYSHGFGGYSSSGDTYYVNKTSMLRERSRTSPEESVLYFLLAIVIFGFAVYLAFKLGW